MSGPPASPPRLAAAILARALGDDPAAGAILGDLREDFARISRRRGALAAGVWYWKESLLLATGRGIRHPSSHGSGPGGVGAGLRGILQDAWWALRSLRRSPAHALFTAGLIGLGVAAATAVFSVLEPFVLAPLPLDEAEELVWIANEETPGDNSLSSVTSRSSNLRDFRERTTSFDGLTGYDAFFDQSSYTLAGAGEPERLAGVRVVHDFLEVLGVDPLYGRGFTREEGMWDGPPAVILSHGFWKRRFAADPGIVGRALTLNGTPRTVVGVLPPAFDFSSIFSPGSRVDFLLPFPVSAETDRWGNTLVILGRLRPGVSPEAAQAELDAVVAGLEEAQPDRWGLGARLTPLREKIAGPFRPALLLLAAAAGTLLLIVCVNVSNLLLARAPARAREMAVRKAMGASRTRLVRQLVLETLALSLLGAAAGALLARGAIGIVSRTAGLEIPLLDQVGVDLSALLFAVAVAALTGLVVGLVPALRVGDGGEAEVLRSSGRGSSAGREAGRLRDTLVVTEVALACVLLVVGGLLVRSFRAVVDVDLGFEAEGAVAWRLNPGGDFGSLREATDFYQGLTARVRRVPGVEEVGLIDALPLGRSRSWGFSVVGVPERDDTDDQIYPHIVDPGYLPAMRIPRVAGRNLDRDDTGESPPVVLMNESGVRRVFQGEEGLGRRIRLWDEREWEIVGVVRDVRHLSPEMGPGIQVYFPLVQMGDFPSLDLVVRSSLPADRIAPAVSAALAEVDPSMPTNDFWTVRSTVDRAISARRFTLSILTAYGAAALFLAALGIYGVLAHAVAERRAEIGIRMALGATSPDVLWGLMGRTLLLAGGGIAAGGVVAYPLARLLDSLLYGVSPADPLTFLGTGGLLLLVVVAAGAGPAVRASRVRGLGALRGD